MQLTVNLAVLYDVFSCTTVVYWTIFWGIV